MGEPLSGTPILTSMSRAQTRQKGSLHMDRNVERRCKIAEQLRNEGKTFRQIGAELNVSLERARQLVLSARMQKESACKRNSIPWFSLSTRTRNRIMFELSRDGHLTCDEFPSPQLVRELVNNGTIHRNLPSFGRLSLQELEQWLRRHGV